MLHDIEADDTLVCLIQEAEAAEIVKVSPVNPFLGIQSIIPETLPHSYTLKYGQDYELWFPDFFSID